MIYLYGITAKPRPVPEIAAAGVDGEAAVEAIAAGPVLAWVSRVSRAGFADELEKRMENLDWLADASVRHQRVVSEVAARLDVLPARFGTLYASPASLQQDLKSRAASLKRAFARIRGAQEWGVKVFTAASRPKAAAAASAVSGRDYLQKKALRLRAQPTSATDDDIRRFSEALGKASVAMAAVGRLSSAQPALAWQAAFLVKREHAQDFHSVLREYAAAWGDSRRIECTGPWPPYSFVGHER